MTSDAPSTTGPGRLPEQRTAVITGAGGPAGIGRVTARILAENGWHVALVDINADGLAAVETELRDAGHQGVLAVPTNIASESSVNDLFARIDAELPPVVGLVNLAGIASQATLHECELAEFERVMAVNVTGSYLMLKAAAARMIPQGVGRIVNTSSITAFDGGGTFSKGRLRHREGRRDRHGPRRRARARPVRDHRERAGPRTDRHRDHGWPAHR